MGAVKVEVRACALWALAFAVLLLNPALASRFKESFTLSENRRVGPIVEGPVYGMDGGFIGVVTGTPYVGFEGKASFVAGDEPASMRANLTIMHTSSKDILPMFDASLPLASRLLNLSVLCDSSQGVPTRKALHAFGKLESFEFYELAGNEGPAEVFFRSPVKVTGYQYLTFLLCRKHHKSGVIAGVDVDVDGDLIFRNPYGYLPARYYGFLPFLGILSSFYLILLLVYGYLAIRYRKTILRMQWGVLAVILMGMIETTTWFLTYVVMNDSGQTSCCPWRSDIVFAMFAKNLKQTVSGMLVLAVAQGWGVVCASLSRKTTLLIIALGFFYLAFSVKFDLIRMERISRTTRSTDDSVEDDSGSAFWAFPVALCDVLFILAIYFSITDTCNQLEADHQQAKLEMYRTLSGTLRLWGILWFIFTLFDLSTRVGIIPWPWTLEFLLWSFWDVLYLGALFRVAIIWRPTETSDRYAYSAQLPTEHVLDEFEAHELDHGNGTQQRDMEMMVTKS